jgi:hypothetical protein
MWYGVFDGLEISVELMHYFMVFVLRWKYFLTHCKRTINPEGGVSNGPVKWAYR